jgi:hypothetical protein
MEPAFSLSPADAEVVFHALRYYASDMFEAFVEDDESPLLEDAVHAEDVARRLQSFLLVNRQSLVRDVAD